MIDTDTDIFRFDILLNVAAFTYISRRYQLLRHGRQPDTFTELRLPLSAVDISAGRSRFMACYFSSFS